MIQKTSAVSLDRINPLGSTSEGGDESNPPQPSFPQQQQPSQDNDELDPLIMSLTRNDQIDDSSSGASKSVNAPLFGEIPIDGSLVVLLPAAVIGLVGFAMSVNIAMNSGDAIVDSLNQLSEDATAAALAKTNIAAPIGDGCRGICSSDGGGIETFMNSLRR